MRDPRDPPDAAAKPPEASRPEISPESTPKTPSDRPGKDWSRKTWNEATWTKHRPRTRHARQVAMQDQTRAACTESRVLIDGAAERVSSSDQACAVHHEQVAKSRATIAQSRALIKRLTES
ncbi:hypothetical protein [Rhodoplanes roseus]|uniref:hypothetical protein n=1 Tax=Rhodoplanes roseus TaxID=29409 RepID=UPI0011B82891|nr:hypothetical protein [Rhodoplanes roseus]